jgi:hypothetical protein
MKSFNVINWNPNSKNFEKFDVIPYFVEVYNEGRKRPQTLQQFKQFINEEAQYRFWGRCEYEIILVDWPCQQKQEKWDVYKQITMNLEIIAKIVMQEVL